MNKRPKSNKATGRDYTYDKKYQSSPEQKKARSQRNSARAKIIDKYGKSAVKGKDVNHKVSPLKGGTNAMSNLNIESKKVNRGRKK